MEEVCGKCGCLESRQKDGKKRKYKTIGIFCNHCNRYFHSGCTTLTVNDIKILGKSDEQWFCSKSCQVWILFSSYSYSYVCRPRKAMLVKTTRTSQSNDEKLKHPQRQKLPLLLLQRLLLLFLHLLLLLHQQQQLLLQFRLLQQLLRHHPQLRWRRPSLNESKHFLDVFSNNGWLQQQQQHLYLLNLLNKTLNSRRWRRSMKNYL